MRYFTLLASLLLSGTFLLGQVPLTCEDEFILAENATLQGECIQLTSNSGGQRGCAWFQDLTDFSMPFTHDMTMSFGNNDAGGADGICLVYQSNSTAACGDSGRGIGAENIPNSFIIEFDTWQNGEIGDPAADHSSIQVNGDFTNNIDGPVTLPNIEDGNDHTVSFSWEPATMMYTVEFDGNVIMSGIYDIVNNCFGGSTDAYWGYTASTGGAFNEHLVCPGLPPEVIADAGNDIELPCLGALGVLDGGNSDSGAEFTYEWTTSNGNIVSGEFTNMAEVDAAGTYTLTVFNNVTLCESMSSVNVTVNALEAEIDTPAFIDCITGEVILSGANSSSGPDITYQWTTPDGNIVDENGTEATVDMPGTYILTVIYDGGICTEEASVLVEEDPNPPTAFATGGFLLCDPDNLELDGSGSSENGPFSYYWETPDGNILSGVTSLFPVVNAEGEYILTVTNDISGCTDEFTVFVDDLRDLPDAIALDTEIGCGDASVVIDGSLSSFGDEFTYEWTTSTGNITNGQFEQSPEVDQPGTYTLLVTNTDNGCTDMTTVEVTGGANPVQVDIAPFGQITCIDEAVTLDGTGSFPGSGVIYTWTTSNGTIDGPTDGANISATAPGTYTLTIEDTASGCIDSLAVMVTDNLLPPTAEAGSAPPFSCGDTSLTLDGTGSSVGNFTYSWSTVNGNLLSGQDGLMPTVGGPGIYTLLVTNSLTGCNATDDVTVLADADVPNVQIILNDTLDCQLSQLTLDAGNSDNGPDFIQNWTTTNGNFVSGQNGLQPIVNAPGTYTLTIENTINGCDNSETVVVVQDTLAPDLMLATPPILTCALDTTPLNGSGSSNDPEFSYAWTTNNGQLSGPANVASSSTQTPGTYVLTIINNNNQCSTTDSVTVIQNTTPPVVSIPDAAELNCQVLTTNLSASLASPVPNAIYSWSTVNGSLTGPNDEAQSSANAPGLYQVLVTNPANVCSDSTTVMVTQNTVSPVAQAGPDQTITCDDPSWSLGGASSIGDSIVYQWSSPDASLNAPTNEGNYLTTTQGTFVLLVTNTNNFCNTTDTVLVDQNIAPPVAVVLPPALLTCIDTLSLLDGANSTGTDPLNYLWSTPNGAIVGNPNNSVVSAGQQGSYQLLVTQTSNGCTDSVQVSVGQDDNFPTATIAPPLTLTCSRTEVELSGNAMSNSGNTTFTWTTQNGNITANGNTLQPTVDQEGLYTLTVEDQANNCRATAEILVTLDDTAPLADAGSPGLLNCNITSTQLMGSGDAQGAGFTYAWSTPEGNIVSGANQSSPTVNAAGTYVLLVTNTVNECTATSEVIVNIDTLPPTIQIATPEVLTCADTLVDLDASLSDVGDFSWQSLDGNPIINADQTTAEASLAGNYEVQLTAASNGCIATQTVNVLDDLTPPDIVFELPEALDCGTLAVTLDASNSSGGTLVYAWSNDNSLPITNSTTAMPTVGEAGTYSLLLTNANNGCVATDMLTVVDISDTPNIDIASPLTITCSSPIVDIFSILGNNLGDNPVFSWTTDDGNILSGSNTGMIVVDQGGLYTFTVFNPENECENSVSVDVRESLIHPVIELSDFAMLNCDMQSLSLDASGSFSGGGDLIYQWTSLDGNITAGANTATIDLNAPGNYGLLLTDASNSCTDTLEVTVAQDTITPTILLGSVVQLDCNIQSQTIDASGSDSGPAFSFHWTTIDGQIDTGADSPTPSISEPGTYVLVLENDASGCTNTASVTIMQDDAVPMIDLAAPAALNCLVLETNLDGTGTSTGSDLSYSWSTTNGNIVSGADGLMPLVNEPGTYILLVSNSANNCDNTASITVTQDIMPPVANAGLDFTLDCSLDSQPLNGNGSSLGAIYTYAWAGTNGESIENMNLLTPTITTPGTYELLVTNTENFCTSTDQVTVDQNIPVATLAAIQPLCFGDPGVVSIAAVNGGTAPYLYSIDGGNTLGAQTQYSNLPAGVYPVVVEDSNGCIYAETIVLDQPDSLTVEIANVDPEITFGDSIRLMGLINLPVENIQTVSWQDSTTLSCGNCLAPYALPTETSVYRLTVISENGCTDNALVRVFVNRDLPVYIPNAFSPDGDGNNDTFHPFADLGAVTNIRVFSIYDRWGNQVFTATDIAANDPDAGWDGTQGGQLLNPAVFVYYAEIELADGRVEIFKGDVVLVR